jgi:hypothetical protein
MAALMDPEIAKMVQTQGDINKDSIQRLLELNDFLRTKLIPSLPVDQRLSLLKQQRQNAPRSGGLFSKDAVDYLLMKQSVLQQTQTMHQNQALNRANQYLSHSFFQNLIPFLDQLFPTDLCK